MQGKDFGPLFCGHFVHGRCSVFDEAEGDGFESCSETNYPRPATNLTECWVSATVERDGVGELYGSNSLEVVELPKREKDRLALFEEPKGQPTEPAILLFTYSALHKLVAIHNQPPS